MKITYSLFLLLLMHFSPPASLADDRSANIQIRVENSSLKKNYFEVKDAICSEGVPNECRIADLILQSKKCLDQKRTDECTRSREIVERPECVKGIIFYGWLEPGEKVPLEICTDHTGTGRISTRNSRTAPWTLYNWVEAGQTISIK